MKLTEQIAHDLQQAMKERLEPKLSTLRMLKAELQKLQADKGKSFEITDEVSSNYKGFDNNLKWATKTPTNKLISYEELIKTFGYVDKYLYPLSEVIWHYVV